MILYRYTTHMQSCFSPHQNPLALRRVAVAERSFNVKGLNELLFSDKNNKLTQNLNVCHRVTAGGLYDAKNTVLTFRSKKKKKKIASYFVSVMQGLEWNNRYLN